MWGGLVSFFPSMTAALEAAETAGLETAEDGGPAEEASAPVDEEVTGKIGFSWALAEALASPVEGVIVAPGGSFPSQEAASRLTKRRKMTRRCTIKWGYWRSLMTNGTRRFLARLAAVTLGAMGRV